MYKNTILVVFMIFFAGCAQKELNTKLTMFQSVDEKDAVLLQDASDKNYCPRCGMDLVKYYKTSHSASDEKKVYQYCSIHCLEEHLGDGIELKNPLVVDVTTLKFIDATKAYYVVGSRVRGTMSKISKYAFLNEEDARKFQAQNSGEIMDFYEALEVARGDFKNYR
ncbi:nitrous oxide reductase accessory protein NosL [Sulfurimonas sp.]|uniref:nitrous oxide reductase accessory protein NosL n=1 Tax=Sulfurimonas sp. TaxID=2022749 RepID=UPI0025EF68CA|nr:nitrous oxide reductase accessory protein NosL [Sulfurimonas sp.]MBW6487876.1 nitrous oxide reductase accessory protein NosL [Sulfurimonas sp.]